MTYERFYGSALTYMKETERQLLALLEQYPGSDLGRSKSVVYCCSRLKSPESMMKKLEKRGYLPNAESALTNVYDAVGVRVVCAFAEDVYKMVHWLKEQPVLEIVQEKDYFAYPKPNGYRSYHLAVMVRGKGELFMPAEIQVRTIATDCWATLEHQLKYKKDIPNEKLIRSELKRCADEIASVDLSMQTLREFIAEETHNTRSRKNQPRSDKDKFTA